MTDLYGAPWWSVVSAACAMLSAAVSAAGLFFVGKQIRASRNVADLQALKEFMSSINQIERNFADETRTFDQREFYFVELMNLLEVYAAATNSDLLPPVSRSIVREKIRDSIALIALIALIELSEPWATRFNEYRTSESTFEHLMLFSRRNRRDIDRVRERADLFSYTGVE